MRLRLLLIASPVIALAMTRPSLASTNTPLPAGATASITTSAGTVSGTLQESPSPHWITILEAGRPAPTFIEVTGAVVRSEAAPVAETTVSRWSEAAQPTVTVRSLVRPLPTTEEFQEGHYIHGMPKPSDSRHSFTPPGQSEEVPGITILIREAFTLGHYDKYRVPAWVAMRWSSQNLADSEAVNLPRPPFKSDPELPIFARGGTSFDFAVTQMERGHQARDADLEAWGPDAVKQGMLMSNIVPQRKGRNHVVWGKLENAHRFIVADEHASIDPVWIMSGPVFETDDSDVERIGSGTGLPFATYKVIAWEDEDGTFNARGFLIHQDDTDTDLTHYLHSVDEIEGFTGLDFFSDLDDSIETIVEAAVPTGLWD